jgi:glycosyltransferase involved in cell wall biosynthesis
MTSQGSRQLHFVFVSSNDAWGGSEELWSAAAAELASAGHAVTVFIQGVDKDEPRVRRLLELSCTVHDLAVLPNRGLPERLRFLFRPASHGLVLLRLRVGLALARRPDLIVISQGGNHDGVYLAEVCRRTQLPFALIVQKASDLYWPPDSVRARLREIYRSARTSFFVSEHNRRLTEEQLGVELANAAVVRNPFLVSWEIRDDWPDSTNGFRLACVGRLFPKEKGQDLLLRVLAREKWRTRPAAVTFYGSGIQRTGLEEMARHLGLTNVTFAGFVRDIDAIWSDHHALVLPSRCEGLPLVLVEAMLSGRVPIVTNTGGNSEVIEDGATGFLAAAASEDALDEAMERAWQRRGEWRAIGDLAARTIRTLVPRSPEAELATMLTQVARNQHAPRIAAEATADEATS